ncbi:MAG: hypothetical protein U9Q67_04025, partial [Patescibacteria group bacterium]|nr:hypothetical protein [Patescibacteria group bacterium]
YAYEIIPELAKFGASNLKATLSPKHSKIVNLYETDYLDGYSKHQPYHRIIAAAGFAENPVNLIKSLKLGGIMVFPTEANDIRKVTRKSKIKYEQEIFPGSLFVPITH